MENVTRRDWNKIDRVIHEPARLGILSMLSANNMLSFNELKARIKALLRRKFNDKQPILKINGLTIDTSVCEARAGNNRVLLSPKEFSVLEALCRHRGKILSRNQLIEKTTNYGREISDNAIDVVVCGLRRKLKDVGVEGLVNTKRGFGYFVD